CSFTPENIREHKDQIPACAFALFSNDQLTGVQLSTLTEQQNSALFFGLDETEMMQRLGLFPLQDVVDAIHLGNLTGSVLRLLGKQYVEKIQLSKIAPQTVENWFRHDYNHEEQRFADRKQFAYFDPDEVGKAATAGVLTSRYQVRLCTGEQLKKIELSQIPKERLASWFSKSYTNDAEEHELIDRELFANFDPGEVIKAIRLQLLTTKYQMQLLSESQRSALPLALRPKKELVKMGKQDLLQFQFEEVKEALEEKVIAIHQMPIEHLKAFDFSKVDIDVIKTVFPSTAIEDIRFKHTLHKPRMFEMVNGKVTIDEPGGYYCEYTDEQLLVMSEQQREANEALLKEFDPEQQEVIRQRLSGDDLRV
ncbi:MAG: hypothetical protein JSR46_09680, partial [Verrucomicrobia bacterium]|nr:hypothetical protein [Verrucomicrobiota bacterium]